MFLQSGHRAGEKVLRFFEERGFGRIEPALLQPVAPFIDMSGEEIRGRLFLTTDPAGADLCLRPDYTIPVCLDHLKQGETLARYAYLGSVFRARIGKPYEILQAGLESFGRQDRPVADAEILATSLEGARLAGASRLEVRVGDVGLFEALMKGLDLSPYWQRRLRRGLVRGQTLAQLTERSGLVPLSKTGVLAVLERSDPESAKALVQDLLSIAGIANVSGRGAAEIADRFLEQAAARWDEGLSSSQITTLERFLAIEDAPDPAAVEVKALGVSVDAFEERTGFMAAFGLDVTSLRYRGAFLRDLDYYTGFVFEAADGAGAPIVSGGRYDRLARVLGCADDIPAVGAALWLDRLGGGV